MRYRCLECGALLAGEADCLQHTNRHGHQKYLDHEVGEIYWPLHDPENQSEEAI